MPRERLSNSIEAVEAAAEVVAYAVEFAWHRSNDAPVPLDDEPALRAAAEQLDRALSRVRVMLKRQREAA